MTSLVGEWLDFTSFSCIAWRLVLKFEYEEEVDHPQIVMGDAITGDTKSQEDDEGLEELFQDVKDIVVIVIEGVDVQAIDNKGDSDDKSDGGMDQTNQT